MTIWDDLQDYINDARIHEKKRFSLYQETGVEIVQRGKALERVAIMARKAWECGMGLDTYWRLKEELSELDRLSELASLHDNIVKDVPELSRNQVWCHECGHTEKVDSAECLRKGWPEHCGSTMSIDSPEERK